MFKIDISWHLLKMIIISSFSVFFIFGCAQRPQQQSLQMADSTLANRQMQTRRFDTTNREILLSSASALLQDLGFNIDEVEYPLGVIVASKERDARSGAQMAGAVFVALLGGGGVPIDSHQIIRVSMVMREVEAPESIEKAKEDRKLASKKLSAERIAKIRSDVVRLVAINLKSEFPEEVNKKISEKIAEDTASVLGSDLTTLMAVKNEKGGSSIFRVTFQRIIFNTAGNVTLREQINDPAIYRDFFDKLAQSVFLEAYEI